MLKRRKEKICYISYRRDRSPVLEHFSHFVSHHGYDVTMITLCNPGQESFEIDNGRKIHRISVLNNIATTKRLNKLRFVSKVIAFLNRNDFSIIHMDTNCPYFILLKIFTLNNSKFVYHILTYPLSTSHLRSLKKMLASSIQCLFMDKTIVQSEELREHWIGIRNLRKTVVIPVGFNNELFHPIDRAKKFELKDKLRIQKNCTVLVYCGAIAKLRHIDRMIEAFKKVHTIFEDLKLLMIGDGDALAEMKALARSLHVDTSIVFTGRTRHVNVVDYIAMADIGISYIPINENYHYNPPLKTFEYLACGLPTIATRTESNSRIIKDGFNGILVNDTPDELAACIINLLRDKKRQALLRGNARKSIMAFDFEHITENALIPLYMSLLRTNVSS